MKKMDPRLWLMLDNLRCGYPPDSNLTPAFAFWAAKEARRLGFVCDEIKPNRLTRKGEIALRLSLAEDKT